MDDRQSDERDYVRSLARGLEVIRAFNRFRARMTLSEVARQTGMTRAGARRILRTLVRENYAETDGKHFSLRPRVLELGFSYLSSIPFWETAQPIIREVVSETRESCSGAVLDDTEIVYVARVPMQRVMTVGLSIGSRLPAYCTSMGRVLLAELPEDEREAILARTTLEALTPHTVRNMVDLRECIETARRQGWALVDQELEIGLRSIAVPIRNRRGDCIAALNIGTHAGRVSLDEMKDRLLPPLLGASQRISASLPA